MNTKYDHEDIQEAYEAYEAEIELQRWENSRRTKASKPNVSVKASKPNVSAELIAQIKRRYDAAKSATTGATVQCPTCGIDHVKTTWAKTFCSNGRTHKGGSNCKDRFWNITEPQRLQRARSYKS